MNERAIQLFSAIDALLLKADFSGLIEACKAELVDARRSEDRELEAIALLGLAQAHHYTGKFHDARVFNDGALRYAQELAATDIAAHALNTSAALFLAAGYKIDEAEADYRAALRLAHDLGDRPGTIMALIGLASTYQLEGDFQRAMNYAREAFEAARLVDDKRFMAMALEVMGSNFARSGQHENALKSYQDALDMIQDGQLRLLEGRLTGCIGALLAENARYHEDGLKLLQESLDTARQQGCVPHEFEALQRLAHAHLQIPAYDEANRIYDDMLGRAQSWSVRPYEAIAFYELARLCLHTETYDDALAHFEQAKTIFRETMNPFQEARTEAALGLTHSLKHDFDQALSHYMAARSIYDALDDGHHTREMTKAILMTYIKRIFDGILRLFGLRKSDEER